MEDSNDRHSGEERDDTLACKRPSEARCSLPRRDEELKQQENYQSHLSCKRAHTYRTSESTQVQEHRVKGNHAH